MRKVLSGAGLISLAAAVFWFCGLAHGSQAYSGRSIVLSAGRLIDGNGGPPLEDADVVIQGDRIAAVGPRGTVSIPAGATILNVRGWTVLPGVMNVHAHHTHVVSNMLDWGREGATTIRNLVSEWDQYLSCKDFLSHSNDPRLPRVLFAGLCLDVPGGRYRTNGFFLVSIEDARSKVNYLLDQGVDVIKVYLDDGSTMGETWSVMPPEMLRAIVETAHARNARVSVHVQELWCLVMALDCGVDDIAHSILDQEIPDEVIARMVRSDTYLVPTLEIYDGWFPREVSDMAKANLRRLNDAGAPIALGTDFEPGLQTGMPTTEMRLMRESGMTPMQVIVAATKHGAHVCGLDSALGTIEPGKIADILVVDGNPLTDLAVLKNNLKLVFHNGRVAFSRLTSGSPF
jgi:imidazolonepropionase-like amidohydrolase